MVFPGVKTVTVCFNTPSLPSLKTMADTSPDTIIDRMTGKTIDVAQKSFQHGIGSVLIIMGAIAIVPSALGVAQYTTRKDLALLSQAAADEAYSIYIVQAIILSFASAAFVFGVVMLAIKKKTAAAAA